MPDDETTEERDTYRPTRTRFETVEVPGPTGGTRTVRFRILAGQTYEVVPEGEAEDRLGYAPINNVAGLIRESARDAATS